MISIGKRITVRAPKSDKPISDALSRCVMEFAKIGVLPSKIHRLVVDKDVYDQLAHERGIAATGGEQEWLNVAGVIVERSA